jgi:cell division septation protein DedD
MADVTQPPEAGGASSPAKSVTRRADAEATHAQASNPDAASAINAKLAKLEEHLQGIGKTLTLHMGKEEVVTRSLIELESKIKKLERSLQETVPPTSSAVTVPKMEIEPDDTRSRGTAVAAKHQLQPSKMSATTGGAERERSAQPASTPDFSYPRHTDHEETSSFIAESPDVFEPPPDRDSRMPGEDRFTRAGGEGKKTLFIIIPVLCLLALFLYLVFYYNNLQKQADTKLTITEQISISSIPVDTVTSQPVPAGEVQHSETKPALADVPVPSPESIPAQETKEEGAAIIPSTVPSQGPAAPKGFTVAVGAFKQKANAIDLTSQLTGKGYPAQMALVKSKKLFRVTVGTFESRKEAAVLAAQIQKNEKLNTAILDLSRP